MVGQDREEANRLQQAKWELTSRIRDESNVPNAFHFSGDHGNAIAPETRGKLKQQRAQLAPEPCRLLKKRIERRVRARQAEEVRDLLRRLDGKDKAARHCGRPALVGRSPVRPAEGRVDLDRREALRIALEMASRRWKQRRVLLGDRPPGATDA